MSEENPLQRLPEQEPLEPELIRQILDNQTQQLLNEQREQSLREREIDNSHTYAMKLLEVQAADRSEERTYIQSFSNAVVGVVIVVSFVSVAALCFALYLGKEQFVLEVVKALGFIIVGALGGYSAKKIKEQNDADSD